MSNLRFADDIGLTRSGPALQEITTQIDETSRKIGLMINVDKIKTMVIEKRKETPLHVSINIEGENIKKGIQRRIGRTSQTFGLTTRILKSKELYKNNVRTRK